MRRSPVNANVRRQLMGVRDSIRNYGFVRNVLRALERIDGVDSPVVSVYGIPTVTLLPQTGTDARPIALAAHALLKAAKLAHPLAVGSATAMSKEFDQFSGKIVYTIPTSTPVKVRVTGGDARCSVKVVKSEEWIPASEGYMSKSTKYVLENPDECGAKAGTK